MGSGAGRALQRRLPAAGLLAAGYTIVVWRGRHVAEPTELDEEEAGGYWRGCCGASALERHYRPVKLNLQMLGNAVPHLHTHLLPRLRWTRLPGGRCRSRRGSGPRFPRTCPPTRWPCGPWSDPPELRVGDPQMRC